jgi:sugar lactone lactonase YvrE
MHKIKRSLYILIVVALLSTTVVFAKSSPFPEVIPLPDGFRPEGIVSGYGTDFYAGSLANGAIFKGDFRSGEGDILVEGATGNISVGLSFDERTGYLFVAGGTTGMARVYDTASGELAGSFALSSPGSFINDVVVTHSAAFFTDSFNARLFKLPLSPDGGLPDPASVEALPLSGDWVQAGGFNANGIDATPNGDTLILVNSGLGRLFTVDPSSGEAESIDLGGASVTAGDGILLDGKTLYVVRNQLNQIAAIKLAPDFSSGEIITTLTHPAFDVPTTVTEFGSRLYAVNARFSTAPTPTTQYDVVQVSKP